MLDVIKKILGVTQLQTLLAQAESDKALLLQKVEGLQRQLRVGESAWEIACELAHDKDARYRKLHRVTEEMQGHIDSLMYENRKMRRYLDDVETRERAIEACDLIDVAVMVTADVPMHTTEEAAA